VHQHLTARHAHGHAQHAENTVAKIVFSAVVGDARYKCGGIFFSENRFGSFIGTTQPPRNPRSVSQRGIRGSLSTLAYRWGWVLTQGDRDDWSTWAQSHKITDVFSVQYALSGLAAFIWVNQQIYKVGGAIINQIPPSFSCGDPGPVTVDVSGAPLALTITTTNNPAAGEKALVYVTAALSPGRLYVGKRWTIADYFPLGVAGPYDVTIPWQAKFGAFPSGARVHAQANFVNPTEGSVGTPSSGYDTVP
jgi:hypothetical protein